MSKTTKNLINSLKKQGFTSPLEEGVSGRKYLELAKKDERGIPRTTGVHRVRFIRDEFVRDVRVYIGKDKSVLVQGVRYYFWENGEERVYDVPLYQKDFYLSYYKGEKPTSLRKYNYLLDRFAEIDEGDELEIEYVQKGIGEGYIDVRKITEGDDIDDFLSDEEKKDNDTPDPFLEPVGNLVDDFSEFMNENNEVVLPKNE